MDISAPGDSSFETNSPKFREIAPQMSLQPEGNADGMF